VRPLLFDRFPALDLPHTPLGEWPTPVRELDLGDRRLWVKDEGRAGRMGGNKVRKLELLLADALARGAGDLLTLGAVGSSHVLATALYGRQLGLRPFAVLFPQPDSPFARRNARLIDALCEGWLAVARRRGIPAAWAREYAALTLVSGRAPYAIPAGGSNALGALGWASAGLELAGQLPRIDKVYVADGTGGTAAGLWLGLRLAGVQAEVVAVRVVDRWIAPPGRLWRLARGALARLRAAGAEVPDPSWTGLRVEHGWFAGGYGRTDTRVIAAIEEAARSGLVLEGTYTGKAFGAALEGVRASPPGEVHVFVSTVDAQPLDDLLAEALPEVPAAMRPLLR
jgi:D-cysteine desulfhydrase